MKYNNEIYRSYDGGIAPLEYNLDIRTSSRIGSYDQSQVYSTEVIGDYIYFGITSTIDAQRGQKGNGCCNTGSLTNILIPALHLAHKNFCFRLFLGFPGFLESSSF